MHIVFSVGLIMGAFLLLLAGLARVLHDLLERSPHSAPLIQTDDPERPRRLQGSLMPQPNTADAGYAASFWDRDGSRF